MTDRLAGNGPVLPALRMGRLARSIDDITGDRQTTFKIMDAISEHLENDSMRWGNACSECGEKLSFAHGRFHCNTHGLMRDSTLLVGFPACKTGRD